LKDPLLTLIDLYVGDDCYKIGNICCTWVVGLCRWRRTWAAGH